MLANLVLCVIGLHVTFYIYRFIEVRALVFHSPNNCISVSAYWILAQVAAVKVRITGVSWIVHDAELY